MKDNHIEHTDNLTVSLPRSRQNDGGTEASVRSIAGKGSWGSSHPPHLFTPPIQAGTMFLSDYVGVLL